MIPVSDALRSRTFPFVNIALILANIAVFAYELSLSQLDTANLFFERGIISIELTNWLESPSGLEEPATVFTSMFLHGGWLHLIGNMLFLWVFGDNVEDTLGHLGYLLFYAVGGIGAVALQVYLEQDSVIPMIGASGAISGVLGGYLLLYPRATVRVVIPLLWFFGALPVRAVILIGFWFVLQLFYGVASLGPETEIGGGVAFWAHVGGFLTGLLIIAALSRLLTRRSRYRRP